MRRRRMQEWSMRATASSAMISMLWLFAALSRKNVELGGDH